MYMKFAYEFWSSASSASSASSTELIYRVTAELIHCVGAVQVGCLPRGCLVAAPVDIDFRQRPIHR